MSLAVQLNLINNHKFNADTTYKANSSEFADVFQYIELADFEKAATLAQERIENGCWDIRYWMYLLLGHWMKITCVSELLEHLDDHMTLLVWMQEAIEAGCYSRKLFVNSIEWLQVRYASILDERSKNKSLVIDVVLADLEVFDKYAQAMAPWADKIDNNFAYKLKSMITGVIQRQVSDQDDDDSVVDADPVPVDALATEKPGAKKNTKAQPKLKVLKDNSNKIQSSQPIKQGNDKWQLLLANIERFHQLVASESWLYAAVLYAKVASEIENFKPEDYFPEIFSEFYIDLATGYQSIVEKLNFQASPAWASVLERICAIDPECFSQLPDDIESRLSLGIASELSLDTSPLEQQGEHGFMQRNEGFGAAHTMPSDQPEGMGGMNLNAPGGHRYDE